VTWWGFAGPSPARRTAETWARALKEHGQSAHGGQYLESCAGCRELKSKYEKAVSNEQAFQKA
jgi:hypothetical protein